VEQNSELLAAHRARWAAVDPLLADSRALPAPEGADAVLTCPGGTALVRNVQAEPDSWGHTFFATRESKLVPRVGDPRAFAELLDLWAGQDTGTFRPGPDSIVSLNWPSRDTAMARALVERGFQPQAVFAVRLAGKPLPGTADDTGVLIRRAEPSDTEAMTRLWMEQLRWEAQFGYVAIRPATAAGLAQQIAQAVAGSEKRAWIAERDGEAVGQIVLQPPEHAEWAARSIRVGPAAYLNCGAVAAGHRGGGVGSALVRHVHAESDAEGIAAILLHYVAVNPLSGPFWSRCGYRPLFTNWTRGTVG
jgi:predicted N-acetyltransferase YhbS